MRGGVPLHAGNVPFDMTATDGPSDWSGPSAAQTGMHAHVMSSGPNRKGIAPDAGFQTISIRSKTFAAEGRSPYSGCRKNPWEFSCHQLNWNRRLAPQNNLGMSSLRSRKAVRIHVSACDWTPCGPAKRPRRSRHDGTAESGQPNRREGKATFLALIPDRSGCAVIPVLRAR